MLSRAREWASAWAGKALLAVLVVSFGLFWGMGDIFRPRHPLSVVATIEGHEIKTQDLHNDVLKRVAAIEASLGRRLQPQEILQASLPGQVLAEKIRHLLLDLEVKRLGIGVPDQVVQNSVYREPAFLDKEGNFDRTRFEAYLKANRWREHEFVEKTRQQLCRAQLVRLILSQGASSPLALDLVHDALAQKRSVSLYKVTPPALPLGTPTEGELRSIFRENPAAFKHPPRRDVTYVVLNDLETAKKIDALLNEGESLESLSKQGKVKLVKLRGLVSGRAALPRAVETYIFSQKLNAISPLQKEGGQFFFTRVDAVVPERLFSYEEALPKIKVLWAEQARMKKAAAYAHGLLKGGKVMGAAGFLRKEVFSLEGHESDPHKLKSLSFEMAPGEKRVVVRGQDVFIVSLDRVEKTPLTRSQQKKIQERLEEMVGNDFISAYMRNLESRYTVQVNAQALSLAF